MRYKVFIKEGDKPEQFLNAASDLFYLKRKQADVNRWMFEMGVVVDKPEKVKFTIYDGSDPVLTRTLVGASCRSWKKTVLSSK